jgi:hypothetical protein
MVRQTCLGNVIQDLEDLQVYAYLLAHLPAPGAVAHEVSDRMARRWVSHALSRSQLKKSLPYDVQGCISFANWIAGTPRPSPNT